MPGLVRGVNDLALEPMTKLRVGRVVLLDKQMRFVKSTLGEHFPEFICLALEPRLEATCDGDPTDLELSFELRLMSEPCCANLIREHMCDLGRTSLRLRAGVLQLAG